MIYGEESKNPKKVVPRATYLAVSVITVLFALTAFAMVTGMGAEHVVEKTAEPSTGGKEALADPAAVLFSLATQYVGPWMATVMSILPARLATVNRRGAPSNASMVTSVISGLVIVTFAIFQLDPVLNPVLNPFYWFSGLAVVSIVLIEILVCIAVVAYFRKNRGSENIFQTMIAPVLAIIGLVLGEYLLMSRFGLLAGTVAPGVDPSVTRWGLSPIGWVLIPLPFALLVVGYIVSRVSRDVNEELVRDVLS